MNVNASKKETNEVQFRTTLLNLRRLLICMKKDLRLSNSTEEDEEEPESTDFFFHTDGEDNDTDEEEDRHDQPIPSPTHSIKRKSVLPQSDYDPSSRTSYYRTNATLQRVHQIQFAFQLLFSLSEQITILSSESSQSQSPHGQSQKQHSQKQEEQKRNDMYHAVFQEMSQEVHMTCNLIQKKIQQDTLFVQPKGSIWDQISVLMKNSTMTQVQEEKDNEEGVEKERMTATTNPLVTIEKTTTRTTAKIDKEKYPQTNPHQSQEDKVHSTVHTETLPQHSNKARVPFNSNGTNPSMTTSTNTTKSNAHSTNTNTKPNSMDTSNQLQNVISSMVQQLKDSTQQIHQTLQIQNHQLNEMEVLAQETLDRTIDVSEKVTDHVKKGWKKNFGKWFLFSIVMGTWIVSYLIVRSIPKRNNRCFLWTCRHGRRYRHGDSHWYETKDTKYQEELTSNPSTLQSHSQSESASHKDLPRKDKPLNSNSQFSPQQQQPNEPRKPPTIYEPKYSSCIRKDDSSSSQDDQGNHHPQQLQCNNPQPLPYHLSSLHQYDGQNNGDTLARQLAMEYKWKRHERNLEKVLEDESEMEDEENSGEEDDDEDDDEEEEDEEEYDEQEEKEDDYYYFAEQYDYDEPMDEEVSHSLYYDESHSENVHDYEEEEEGEDDEKEEDADDYYSEAVHEEFEQARESNEADSDENKLSPEYEILSQEHPSVSCETSLDSTSQRQEHHDIVDHDPIVVSDDHDPNDNKHGMDRHENNILDGYANEVDSTNEKESVLDPQSNSYEEISMNSAGNSLSNFDDRSQHSNDDHTEEAIDSEREPVSQDTFRLAAAIGDYSSLKQYSRSHPEYLQVPDENGWLPLHEAIRSGSTECIALTLTNLPTEMINKRTGEKEMAGNALWLLQQYHGDHHPAIELLQSKGAVVLNPIE